MLLVIDKSSSMTEPMPLGNGQSKWETMKTALTVGLTQIDGNNEDTKAAVNLGVELFPYDPLNFATLDGQAPEAMCQVPAGDAAIAVPIDSFSSKIRAVADALNAQSPGGLTPTAEALRRAYDYFIVGEGRCLRGSKWVFLVTNGSGNCNGAITCNAQTCTQNLSGNCPSDTNCCEGADYLCQDDNAIVATITQLAKAGIHTFVVGIPDNAAAETSLNAYAVAGQMPNTIGINGELYYPITASTGARDILEMFRGIWSEVDYTCEVELSQTPSDPTSIRVYGNCIEIPPATGDVNANGWMIDTSQSPPHLQLYGDACMTIVSSALKALDIYFDCPI
jgi:hypothetical protein